MNTPIENKIEPIKFCQIETCKKPIYAKVFIGTQETQKTKNYDFALFNCECGGTVCERIPKGVNTESQNL